MSEKNSKITTSLAISGFIDLLGFSQHLQLANYDTRTEIGEIAVKRLNNLEKVLKKINIEESKYPQCFPNLKIHRQRFNDAIFFTMDLDEIFNTNIGEHIWRSFTGEKLINMFNSNKENSIEKLLENIEEKSTDVAYFISLLARVHSSINSLEAQSNFPGARTVISVGLKVNGAESLDPFSANFAISNAYIVDSKGSKEGFGGNNFYLDDTAAYIVMQGKKFFPLLYQSGIALDYEYYDPYDIDNLNDVAKSAINVVYRNVRTQETIIFGKKFKFRESNINPLTWIQGMNLLESHVNANTTEIEDSYFNTLFAHSKSTPTISDLSGDRNDGFKCITLNTPLHIHGEANGLVWLSERLNQLGSC